jgi:hypothetical protein
LTWLYSTHQDELTIWSSATTCEVSTVSYQLENQVKRAIQKEPTACADQKLNQMVEEKYDISE